MHLHLGALVLLGSVVIPTLAVKHSDFKTCSNAAFCRRGRALAKRASESSSWHSPYSVDSSHIVYSASKSSFVVPLKSEIYPGIKFELEVRIHDDGVVRVRVDEVDGLRKRYDEAASWALTKEPVLASAGSVKWTEGKKDIRGLYNGVEVRVSYAPFKVSLYQEGREEIVLNGEGFFHVEHFRQKEGPAPATESQTVEGAEATEQAVIQEAKPTIRASAWFEGEEEDGYWEESFLSWTDSKPKGPESFSVDINFPGHSHVYGIPQHAAPLALPTTTGKDSYFDDPYRLWNLDVFEYEASSTMSLYGSIPLLHAHSEHSTVGIFNAVASETWIDISHPSPKSTLSHWISESGIVDIFLLPGPTAKDIFGQYARLTGTPALPAQWALGYHQCRWNYVSSQDMRSVQKKFDEEDFPLDVLWLDIEYSDDHKYFMWEEKNFPDPVEMINDIAAIGRKVVVIVDPHLKRVNNYPPYKEALDNKLLVRRPDGENDYEGWCWPGSSAWVDFFNPASWSWWQGLFSLTDREGVKWRWEESTDAVHIWNDMNEPSVFNGPEITMQKDNIHYGGWEHRDVHNINGMLYHNQTSKAVLNRQSLAKRPFVLSRSFYAGSQKFGAIWTGDNMGTWEHMAVGVSMVLSDGIAGMTFSGADVGGFFGNPEPEMLVRWYQVGAFSPFFRAHAHIDTKRREPYLLAEPYKSVVRQILKLRYSLLPVWYTAFREASVTGIPVLRPHYVMFPKDKKGFAIDNQYYVGSSGLLVKPITAPDVTETQVYFAEDQVYYDYLTYDTYHGSAKGKNITVPAPLEKLPLFIRGGSIVPTRARPRRSSPLMKHDPFTLTIALSKTGHAEGELYLDDGETYQHEKGEVVWRQFKADKRGRKGLSISSIDLASQHSDEVVDGVALTGIYSDKNSFATSMGQVAVEKVIVLGFDGKPSSVKNGSKELQWTWEPATKSRSSVLTVKNPGATIVQGWTITVE
ncbi:hypothetical protein FRC02_008498 [Tulasnella sp. 418]|nr:hypothetical protein FRC02_008498 [Tulasnella sp. 418]